MRGQALLLQPQYMKQQRRKLQIWLPFLFGLTMAAGMFVGYKLKPPKSAGGNLLPGFATSNSVQEVLNLLQYKYVDSVNVDSIDTRVILSAIQGLDPHTVYIPPEELPEANADLEGKFGGVGIEYQMIEDTLTVVYVVDDGPAAKAGIMAGDQFLLADGKPVSGQQISVTELRSRLRGKIGSRVSISYKRNNRVDSLTITRGIIPIPSLDAAIMLNDSVGYIRLNRFSENTYVEFMDAHAKLEKAGMRAMILDLRGNGGGILEEATKIADELLEDGVNIVSTKGLHVRGNNIKATKPGVFEAQQLMVLIDEQTASASEVLAGALQDNDRGVIMGSRSFGKGLVQEQFDLSNGGALRLTVARYFTPSGRSIQKPYTKGRASYNHEIWERSDSAYRADSAAHQRFTTAGGKTVYDGGGITPDVAVSGTAIPASPQIAKLLEGNLLNETSFKLFKHNKDSIIQFKSARSYADSYSILPSDWKNLTDRAAADSIYVANIADSAKVFVTERLKALIARYLWRNEGYYQVLSANDAVIAKALQAIATNSHSK